MQNQTALRTLVWLDLAPAAISRSSPTSSDAFWRPRAASSSFDPRWRRLSRIAIDMTGWTARPRSVRASHAALQDAAGQDLGLHGAAGFRDNANPGGACRKPASRGGKLAMPLQVSAANPASAALRVEPSDRPPRLRANPTIAPRPLPRSVGHQSEHCRGRRLRMDGTPSIKASARPTKSARARTRSRWCTQVICTPGRPATAVFRSASVLSGTAR